MALWSYPEDRYYYGWYGGEGVPPAPPEPKSDGDIKSIMVDRLNRNPHTADSALRVDVKRGVVILNGQVPSRLAKRSAGDDCWDTPGVVDVSNQLEVTGEGPDGGRREHRIGDYMTPDPVCVEQGTPVARVAALMAEMDIGDVLVTADGKLRGIVTDRDLTVRVMAQGLDPHTTPVETVCSAHVVSVGPDDDVEEVLSRMREDAVRRIPVVEGGRPVGVVSLGDVARRRDPGSVLAEISAAAPDR